MKSTSILDDVLVMTDSFPVNALAHLPGGEITEAAEPQSSREAVIEGEFQSDSASEGLCGQLSSGLYCKRCHLPVKVGETACPRCLLEFGLPTPTCSFFQQLPPARQWTILTARIDEGELSRVQFRRRQRRTRPLFTACPLFR